MPESVSDCGHDQRRISAGSESISGRERHVGRRAVILTVEAARACEGVRVGRADLIGTYAAWHHPDVEVFAIAVICNGWADEDVSEE